MNLKGKRGIVLGVANEHSMAAGCVEAIVRQGGECAVTYQNEKSRPYVESFINSLPVVELLPCDVQDRNSMQALFSWVEKKWGKLDFIIHSIAYAPHDELFNPVIESQQELFNTAMDISCHSLIHVARLAEPFMQSGGSILTMSYYGAEKVVGNYRIMGPVKAALEATVRYLAAELGPHGIRVSAVSPGPVATRAASGLESFQELLNQAEKKSAMKRLVTIEEVGSLAAFLVSDASSGMTGQTIYVDAGYHIIG
ncbi:enoyl-ACP reductase FabI [Piscirickettsia litoralis]|uniref:Enoyl-[acyl-carrier-protein] reductase [NADH] n=1 Tax=Piscirickettsia litoralis TaxID=1891921 RepID=A0ABX3A6W2_9GAMM|nr:enoyl-ACP reductase FabI [Piscirickettsia litoralis]ODN41849.1 enoyl-ACP reductase [Piscirickettsia litoralis]